MSMVSASVEQKLQTRLRLAGTALLLLAAVMLVGSFFAVAKTPTGYDLNSCKGPGPCDALTDSSTRQRVFFLGMGATLIVFVGGVWLRSIANRDA
jgi:hypothetical protein